MGAKKIKRKVVFIFAGALNHLSQVGHGTPSKEITDTVFWDQCTGSRAKLDSHLAFLSLSDSQQISCINKATKKLQPCYTKNIHIPQQENPKKKIYMP